MTNYVNTAQVIRLRYLIGDPKLVPSEHVTFQNNWVRGRARVKLQPPNNLGPVCMDIVYISKTKIM